MHLALDRDVRVGDAGGEELAEGAEHEGDGGRDAAPLLDRVLHLLKQGVLQDRVDDEHQGGHDAREEGLGPLRLEQVQEGADGGRLLGLGGAARESRGGVVLGGRLAGGHARVDDPDGVGQDDGGGAGDGAGDHALDRGQLLGGAAGLDGGGLEEGAGPLVPVVVDKVGDADAEQGRREARVEARDALARDDLLDGGQEGRLGALRLDLGAGGEGDERVAVVGREGR